MKRLLFFVSLCLSLTLFASLCVAQDRVSLRIGMHKDYARLVFGWPSKAGYTLEQEANGQVSIRFNKAGSLDLAKADFDKVPGINGVKELSQAPLSVKFQIPEGTRLRDFSIGKRVVVDLYFPEDMPVEDPQPQDKTEEKPSLPAPSPKPKTEPKEVHAVDQEDTHTTVLDKTAVTEQEEAHSKQDMLETIVTAAPPATVLTPQILNQAKAEDIKAAVKEAISHTEYSSIVKEAIDDKHHVVSIRGTQGMSVAAYVENNVLWMTMIGGSSFSQPTLLSPTPELFSKIIRMHNGAFDVYRLELPKNQKNLSVKVIGGALAWDIVIGNKVRHAVPVKPVRIVNSTNGVRGGKLVWPMELLGDIVEITEPNTGKNLMIVTVENASQLSGLGRHFVDFDVLASPVGMTIRPKVDDLIVKKTSEGIEVSRPNSGLTLSLQKDIEAIYLHKAGRKNRITSKEKQEYRDSLLFQFEQWKLGDIDDIGRYEMLLLSSMHGQTESRKVQELIKLGKMFLAHGYAAEALGYFDYAHSLLPALGASAEFRALRGAGKALDWKSSEALADFMYKELQSNDEIKLWKSFVLAELEDWQQAAAVLPEEFRPIYTYPDVIALRMALVLSEVSLRDGQMARAEELMFYIEENKDLLSKPMLAALDYLEGEAARQRGEVDETKRLWKALTKSRDNLYRTKAGLALTMLLVKEGKLNNNQTIDHLERLRYAWRGDGLEAQVKYWLGDAYFKNKKYIKGLSIMREAATIAKDTKTLADRIADDMAHTFTNMYLTDEIYNVSALDAVTVYDQFKELTPADERGDELVQRLAEHLVRSDLLGRAADLLRYQVNHRLKGKDRLRIAIRLSAIELLDKAPQKAFDSLAKAQKALKRISDKDEIRKRQREINLLKVRAYSQNGEYNKALSLIDKLPMDKMVNRLRVDIAWKAGYWDIASASLKEVLIDEKITSDTELMSGQVDLILNRAIALNLNSDRIALANMREKYSRQMVQANRDKARQFELITRKQRSAVLDDREALMSAVSEVDLFQGFLESYRNLQNE